MERARAGIERLVRLTPRSARRIACPGEALARSVEDAVAANRERSVELEAALARLMPSVDADAAPQIPAEQVQVGDLLRVNPGETVPVDDIIVSGHTSINQAVMTGESISQDKRADGGVASGTLNQFGSFDMVATRVGEDSSI